MPLDEGIGKTLYFFMTRDELVEALRRLGELLPEKAQIVIAGGAALILGDYVDRGTSDGEEPESRSPRNGMTRGGP